MNEILYKLKSRKLWLAIAGVATGIAMVIGIDGNEITTVAGAVTSLVSIVTYIVTEGKVDAAATEKAVGVIAEGVELLEGDVKEGDKL